MNKIYIIQTGEAQGDIYATRVRTRDIRLQGENVEKILVDYFEKFKDVDYKLSGISKEEIEGELYETLRSTIGDVNDKISIIEQKANRIDLLVKTKDGTSELEITDKLINMMSKAIRITAENIDLNGYVSNRKVKDENGNEVIVEGNWHIDDSGNAEFNNLSVDEDFSCDTIVVNEITSPKYPQVLTGNLDLYVDAVNGKDDSELKDEAVFKTINAIFDKLPKDLNGHLVTITLRTDITENIKVYYRSKGRIYLFLNGFTVKGWVREYMCDCELRIMGGGSLQSTNYGSITPPSLYAATLQNYSVFLQKNNFTFIDYVKIYGSEKNTNSAGLGAIEGGFVMVRNVEFYDVYNGVHVARLAHLYASDTKGKALNIGWRAQTGGRISLNSGGQLSGTKENTSTSSAGEIYTQGAPIYQPDKPIDKNPEKPGDNNDDDTKTTKTVTYKTTSADTYKSTVYNSWKRDSTCRQGNFGYGNCNGCWFFGSQFNNLKGKTIKSVKITIKRQKGGYAKAVNLTLKMHNHSSRPSGAPSYYSGWERSISLDMGESKTIEITDTSVLNAIKAGSVKGFGLQSSYSKSTYAVCSGACTVKITYVG